MAEYCHSPGLKKPKFRDEKMLQFYWTHFVFFGVLTNSGGPINPEPNYL